MILAWTTIGIVVGLLLGLTGAGGALIAVPLFVYLVDATIREATSLSLIAVISGSVLNWMLQFRATDYKLATLLFILSGIGSLAFRPLKEQAPEWMITTLFIGASLWSLIELWKKRNTNELKMNYGSKVPHQFLKASSGGLLLGGLTTMTGIGGGVILIPLVKGLFKKSMSEAAATSLLTVLLSSIFSFWIQREAISNHLSIDPVLALTGGSIVAALSAKKLSVSMEPENLDHLRLWLISAVIFLSAASLIFKII